MSLAALALAGCGDDPVVRDAELTVGAEGFEPPVLHVPARTQVDLTVHNETAKEQRIVVEGDEPLAIPAGGAGGADLGRLEPGRYRITLEGTPFEATLVAEPG